MDKSKYGKYIITESTPGDPEMAKRWTQLLLMDSDIIPGAYHMSCAWHWTGSDKELVAAHTHDVDEVLAFFGTDPESPNSLGGEVELWLGDEKHILTKSFIAFLPQGLRHCPLIVRRVDRPILGVTILSSGKYSR